MTAVRRMRPPFTSCEARPGRILRAAPQVMSLSPQCVTVTATTSCRTRQHGGGCNDFTPGIAVMPAPTAATAGSALPARF